MYLRQVTHTYIIRKEDAVSMVPEYRFPLKQKCGFLRIGTPVSDFRNWGVKPPGILNGACPVAGIFLTIVQISSEFVGGQCASWRLPPKAAVSACRRHSFVEGIRNGGLDVTQNRRSTRKIHYGRTKLPALQRFFSFPVLRGRIAWLIRF